MSSLLHVAALLLVWLLPADALSQGLILPPDSEHGFRQVMQAARDGAFGEDVADANIGIMRTGEVLVELVRPGKPSKHFVLRRRQDSSPGSHYFAITVGEGSTAADAATLAAALDAAFPASPFRRSGIEQPLGMELPSLDEIWRSRGGALLGWAAQRMMVLRGQTTTAAIILALGLGTLGALCLLWTPPSRVSSRP